MEMEEILTISEASRYLKVHKATIYKLAQQGGLPGFKVGKVWRFKKDQIDAWVEKKGNYKNLIGAGNQTN